MEITMTIPDDVAAEIQNGTSLPLSRQLLVEFLKATYFDAHLARYIKPRHPFRTIVHRTWHEDELTSMGDIGCVSELVNEIEYGQRTLPILLKHYVKLGGRVLGFNIDAHFGEVIDGLIMVDLPTTDHRILERYMCKAGVQKFLAFHHNAGTQFDYPSVS